MSWHDTLADAWRSVVTNTTEPGTHPRDLAASLGRTEAELLAAAHLKPASDVSSQTGPRCCTRCPRWAKSWS